MSDDLPRIVGLNGVARAGKDTVAEILVRDFGYEIVSFSDLLNRCLVALNPIVVPGTGARYATLEKLLGYEVAKEIPEVRALLQRMGTEVGRNLIDDDLWVKALFGSLDERGRYAIVNVRFPNEAEGTLDAGGVVWRVERPGYEAAQGHSSDTALDDWFGFEHVIANDGTLEDLRDKVTEIMASYAIQAAAQRERAPVSPIRDSWTSLGWLAEDADLPEGTKFKIRWDEPATLTIKALETSLETIALACGAKVADLLKPAPPLPTPPFGSGASLIPEAARFGTFDLDDVTPYMRAMQDAVNKMVRMAAIPVWVVDIDGTVSRE